MRLSLSRVRTSVGTRGLGMRETGGLTNTSVRCCVSRLVLIINCLVIVYDNGRSGFLGEHSCRDGTPTLRMNEYILATIAVCRADLGPERNAETGKDLAQPEELLFEVNGKVEGLVSGAEQRYDELLAQHDMQVRFSKVLVHQQK